MSKPQGGVVHHLAPRCWRQCLQTKLIESSYIMHVQYIVSENGCTVCKPLDVLKKLSLPHLAKNTG